MITVSSSEAWQTWFVTKLAPDTRKNNTHRQTVCGVARHTAGVEQHHIQQADRAAALLWMLDDRLLPNIQERVVAYLYICSELLKRLQSCEFTS